MTIKRRRISRLAFYRTQFLLVNPRGFHVTEGFVMSGPPDDMHREFLKLKDDTPKYIEKKYIGHTLYKVEFINLYTSPDAIISHSDPPAVVPVVATAVVPVPPANPVSV